jgi:hypothetical protein
METQQEAGENDEKSDSDFGRLVRMARVGSNLLALDSPMLACKGITQIPLALSLESFKPILDNAQFWRVARPAAAADAIAAHLKF